MKAPPLLAGMVAASFLIGGSAAEAQVPTSWDGLARVESKRLEYVYLQPGADFTGYSKVLIDPAEIAFEKDWQRDYNRSNRSLAARVSNADVQDAIRKGVVAAQDIFTEVWAKSGYAVVQAPGPDVLRIRVGVLNIRVTAPDQQAPGRSFSFSEEAGRATLFIEARDSVTGALIGRAVDPRVIGDTITTWRTATGNRADFRNQVKEWAEASVRGMSELKALSPVTPRDKP